MASLWRRSPLVLCKVSNHTYREYIFSNIRTSLHTLSVLHVGCWCLKMILWIRVDDFNQSPFTKQHSALSQLQLIDSNSTQLSHNVHVVTTLVLYLVMTLWTYLFNALSLVPNLHVTIQADHLINHLTL